MLLVRGSWLLARKIWAFQIFSAELLLQICLKLYHQYIHLTQVVLLLKKLVGWYSIFSVVIEMVQYSSSSYRGQT